MNDNLDDIDDTDEDDNFPWEDVMKCLGNKTSSVTGKTSSQMREDLQSADPFCPLCKKPLEHFSIFYFRSPPDT